MEVHKYIKNGVRKSKDVPKRDRHAFICGTKARFQQKYVDMGPTANTAPFEANWGESFIHSVAKH